MTVVGCIEIETETGEDELVPLRSVVTGEVGATVTTSAKFAHSKAVYVVSEP